MSRLQKAIARIQRREGPRIGFGLVAREKPRAMLAAVAAESPKQVAAAIQSGADIVVVKAGNAAGYAAATSAIEAGEVALGALLPSLDPDGAAALQTAGCDFVISPLSSTVAAAVDHEKMGHVVSVALGEPEALLRSLGPLSFEALFLEAGEGGISLASQLEFVRLATLSSTPLIVAVRGATPAAELRVLRDSGVAAILLPAGSSNQQVADLVERLKSVPAPRKAPGRGGHDVAMLPFTSTAAEEEEPEPDDDDD